MRIAAIIVGLLLATVAQAGGPLEFKELNGNPSKYSGKQVTFRFSFTRIQPSVNKVLARRGIKDSNYVEIQTAWRPASQTGLILLVSQKKGALIKALRDTKRRSALYLSGSVRHLTGDQGARWYYVDVTGMTPVKKKSEKKPAETKKSGSKKATAVSLKALLASPAKYVGKKIKLSAVYLGEPKEIKPLVARLTKLDPQKQLIMGLAKRTVAIIRKSDKKSRKTLKGMTKGQSFELEGTFKQIGKGRRVLRMLLVTRVKAGPKKK